jgi:hypothetical protein
MSRSRIENYPVPSILLCFDKIKEAGVKEELTV